jgi:aspartate kinase
VKLTQLINKNKGKKIYLTQGFICRNSRGEVDNLKRGGSDYSASIIAAAINASVCEIWTDIHVMHNNDSSLVDDTTAVHQLSFEEAAELAYFGAKVLHPASIWPARHYNVPVKLLNTTEPNAEGTLIVANAGSVGVKAIAAKDNITAINIKSSRMLLAYGFLRKIFEVFEFYKTPIDMVTTSEIAVSLTIDNKDRLGEISQELEAFGVVEIDEEQTIITIVGNEITQTPKVMARIFESISEIPIRMVSYGGSRHNISLLVSAQHKKQALQLLNKGLFNS